MVAIFCRIGSKILASVIHAHRMNQKIIGVEPADEESCRREEIKIRVFILGIKTPMLDGEGFVIHFTVIDPIIG
jgi:hypothetical protein